MIDFDLTDEQRPIQETARDFANREIIPRATTMDRAGELDPELVRKLGEIGFHGAIVAEEYGDRGRAVTGVDAMT